MQSVSARCHATSSHMPGNCGAQKLLVPIAAQHSVVTSGMSLLRANDAKCAICVRICKKKSLRLSARRNADF
jgi:hypothetical protein